MLRVVLPDPLLAEVDRHLGQEGSGRTRADFVVEAVEQRLLELRFAAPSDAQEFANPAQPPQPPLASEEVDLSDDPLITPRTLADTRLPAPDAAPTLAHDATTAYPVEPGPLFLHTRDYPSLWCLTWLTRWADDAPIELGEFLNQVTRAAWTFAERLKQFDHPSRPRASTMFPASLRNPDSSSQTFQSSAVGGLVQRRDGSKVVVGPLSLWGVAKIYLLDARPVIAPTQAGIELLAALEDLSLELPHQREHAERFLLHLRAYAPIDHEAFVTILELIDDDPNPTRSELIDALAADGPGETKQLPDVYAQAYVSRAREWGLVEHKLADRRYRLTNHGGAVLASVQNGTGGSGNHGSRSSSGPR